MTEGIAGLREKPGEGQLEDRVAVRLGERGEALDDLVVPVRERTRLTLAAAQQ